MAVSSTETRHSSFGWADVLGRWGCSRKFHPDHTQGAPEVAEAECVLRASNYIRSCSHRAISKEMSCDIFKITRFSLNFIFDTNTPSHTQRTWPYRSGYGWPNMASRDTYTIFSFVDFCNELHNLSELAKLTITQTDTHTAVHTNKQTHIHTEEITRDNSWFLMRFSAEMYFFLPNPTFSRY